LNSSVSTLPKRRVFRGGAFLSLGPIAAILLGFIVSFFVGLYISPDSLGEFSFVNEFISLVTSVALFGLPGAFTKYIAEYLGREDQLKLNSLLKTQTSLTIGICIFSSFFTLIAAPIYFNLLDLQITGLKLLLIVLAVSSTIISKFAVSTINGYYDVERLGVYDLIANVISRLIVILCIIITFNAYSLIVRILVINIILISLIPTSKRRIYTLEGYSHPVKPLFSFGLPAMVAFAIVLIGQNLLLKTLILFQFGQNQVGFFDYAFRLASFINTATLGFFASLSSYYARLLGEGGTRKIGLEGGWIIKSSLVIYSPIIIGSIIIGKLFFEEIVPSYAPAFSFFVILTFGILFLVIFRPFVFMIDAIGKTKVKIYRIFTALPAGYIIFFLTAPLGPLSIVIAWVTMDIVGTLTIYFFCRHYVGDIIIEKKKSLLCLVSALIMGIPVLIVNLIIPGLLAIPFMVIIGFLVYILLVRELHLISEQEIRATSSFVLPKKMAKFAERLLIKS
jgi:O-antigen/teichoic acid export membrane protein